MKLALIFIVILFSSESISSDKINSEFTQLVKKYSSNNYLNESRKLKIKERAERMFKLVEKSYTQNDRIYIKEQLSKKGILIALQNLEFNDMIKKWNNNLQIEKKNK